MPSSTSSQPGSASALQAALNRMAQGSQSDAPTVEVVATSIIRALDPATLQSDPRAWALVHSLPELLQAAGWLHPCFAPGSSLDGPLQEAARQAWVSCVYVASELLPHYVTPPGNMEALLSLIEPCHHPQIPGVLDWMDSLAAQLAPLVQDPPAAAGTQQVVPHLLQLLHQLLEVWDSAMNLKTAVTVLRPGLVRLVQALAMQPLPPPPAGAGQAALPPPVMVSCLAMLNQWCGASLQGTWAWQAVRWAIAAGGLNPANPNALTIMTDTTFTPEVMSAVLGQEDFWWAGVATLASALRLPMSVRRAAGLSPAVGINTPISRSSASSTGGVPSAALCPAYHQGVAWPATLGNEADVDFYVAGSGSLEVLLLREGLGVLPWALQQLNPHTAQQAGADSTQRVGSEPRAIQWPLLRPPSSSNTLSSNYTSTSTSTTTSSRSSSSGTACSCHTPTCYLCTPPPPVTLQQLRLVLEVVCLTCQDSNAPSLRAPLLLALLLQRASADVRAAFLSSADGDCLLVALQQLAACKDEGGRGPATARTWRFNNHRGVLSVFDALTGYPVTPHTAFAPSRAAYTLVWCFLELSTPPEAAAPAAGAATAATGAAGAVLPAAYVTPAAVANGSLLAHQEWGWIVRLHMVQVPSTSLRLAAGVQPSPALFATLEQLLRASGASDLPVLLAAAVEALLEPVPADGCGCCQVLGGSTSTAGPYTTKTAGTCSSIPTDGSTTGTTTTVSSSNSGSHPGPAVVAAVASVTEAVSQVLEEAEAPTASGTQLPQAVQENSREVRRLGLRLSNTVLQLALQQLRHGQDHQQQPGSSIKALLQLAGAAQRLLHSAALQEARYCLNKATTRAATRRVPPAVQLSPLPPQDSARWLAAHIHSGNVRLKALQQALRASGRLPPKGAAGEVPGQARTAATPAGPSAPGSSQGGAAAGQLAGGPQHLAGMLNSAGRWCPVHSSGPDPALVTQLYQLPLESVVADAVHTVDAMDLHCFDVAAMGAWSGAGPQDSVGATTSSRGGGAQVGNQSAPAPDTAAARDQGPGSQGRVCDWCGKASQQLLRCARCKAAWYCGADHQRAAWKAGHKQECGQDVDGATAAVEALGPE